MKKIYGVIWGFWCTDTAMEVSEYCLAGIIVSVATAAVFLALSNGIGQWITAMALVLQGRGP
jgi:hypothetical protein